MSQSPSEKAWRRVPGTEASRFGDEFVLLDASGTVLRGLNPSAAQLWTFLEQARTTAELSAALAEHYGIRAEQVRPDVEAFLELCRSKGLVERVTR